MSPKEKVGLIAVAMWSFKALICWWDWKRKSSVITRKDGIAPRRPAENRDFSRKFLTGLLTMQTTDETAEASKPAAKRGRPPTGNALSDSDRQARRRAKLEAEGKALLPPVVVSQDVKQALAKFIEFKDMTLGEAVDRIVRDRLLRKRSGKHKSRSRANASRPT